MRLFDRSGAALAVPATRELGRENIADRVRRRRSACKFSSIVPTREAAGDCCPSSQIAHREAPS